MPKIKVAHKTVDKEEEKKWPKQAALYIFRPETSYTCQECVFYEDKKCKLFSPTEAVSPTGGCNFYIHAEPGSFNIPTLRLITKLEAGYAESKHGFTCGRCEYYLAGVNGCEKVNRYSEGDTPGIIATGGCCNRFDADKERGEMTDKQLNQLYGKA